SAPPEIRSVRRGDAGVLAVLGVAAPGAAVRLANPGGAAYATSADERGAWLIAVPALGQPTLFGLSSRLDDRVVQAQGYVALLPGDAAWPAGALLRAGAGAETFG